MSRNIGPYEMSLTQHDQGNMQLQMNHNASCGNVNAVAVEHSPLKKINREQAVSKGNYASQISRAQAMPTSEHGLGLTLSPGLQTQKQCDRPNLAFFTNCQTGMSLGLEGNSREAVSDGIDGIVKSRIHFGTKVRYWREEQDRSATNHQFSAVEDPQSTTKVKETDSDLRRPNISASLRPQTLTPLIPMYKLSGEPTSANAILRTLNTCHLPEDQGADLPPVHQKSPQLCADERIAIVALNRRVSDLLFVASKQQLELISERRARNEASEKWTRLHQDYNQLYQSYHVLNEAHSHCLGYTTTSTVAQSPASDFLSASRQPSPKRLRIPLIDLTSPDVNQAMEAKPRSGMPGQGNQCKERDFQISTGASLTDCEIFKKKSAAEVDTVVDAVEMHQDRQSPQHHSSNIEYRASVDEDANSRSQLPADIEDIDWFEEAMFQS